MSITVGDKVKFDRIDGEEGFPYEEIGIVSHDWELNTANKTVDIETNDGRTITMVDKWLCKKIATATTGNVPSPLRQVETLVRQLPSDEEIEKEARVRGVATIVDLGDENSGTVELEEGFIQGAKWMRNQARQPA